MSRLMILDEAVSEDLIRERQRLGNDRYDEVWDGVSVMPAMPNNAHQTLVHKLPHVFDAVVREDDGVIQPGANVSDRDVDWSSNYRIPDILVALVGGRAIDRGTHWQGGLDFLVEIESPGDDTADKIPFYAQIRVREVLVIHRDSRELTLLRLRGDELVEVEPTKMDGQLWLCSEVAPLAFRRLTVKRRPRTAVRHTDGEAGNWTV